MSESFTCNLSSVRVLFGAGTTARLAEEIDQLGLQRVLVLATPRRADAARSIAAMLAPRAAQAYAHAAMHTPVEITAAALQAVAEFRADGLVALGGGSTTGLSKAIAYRTGLPQIVLPTTYAGSEMTSILGETAGGIKKTLRAPSVLPKLVIYDVNATLDLTRHTSAVSGMNALAHAVEALYAEDRNPLVSAIAIEGFAALAAALPRIAAAPADRDARAAALYGAWLCGICLGAVGMSLHHKLCHVLGGSFGLPHAETHSIVLPHAVRYNLPAAPPDAMRKIAAILRSDDAALGLYDLAARIGAPMALRDIGLPAPELDRATDLALANPYWNPRPIERAPLRELLERAWAGATP